MKIESYKTEKLKVEKDLNEMTKKSDLISWIRVALFILIMGLLSYGYFKKIDIFYAFVAALTRYICLGRCIMQLYNCIRIYERRRFIIQKILAS